MEPVNEDRPETQKTSFTSQETSHEDHPSTVNFNTAPDINSAAALRAQYAIEIPKLPRRRHKKLTRAEVEEEPLLDTTTALPLHSKKTQRQQRRQTKKSTKPSGTCVATTLLDLPSEIITEIISCLQVSDIFRLSRTSHSLRDLVHANENAIAKHVLRTRYWILHRCFPLPIPFNGVPSEFHQGLLSAKRQELMKIHRNPYQQHIEPVDPQKVCTCMTCVFAWNNLCLLIDLHHWQSNLDKREPIPMIPRGTRPEWNVDLLRRNAEIVRSAMDHPLWYAAILEKHLATITMTILRSARWRRKGEVVAARPRLYHMTDWDVEKGTDGFLERSGPPSYEFPVHRDVYYSLEAYLPNRKYDGGKWHYYPVAPTMHEKDLQYLKSNFQSTVSSEERARKALANLKDHNIRWSQYLEKVGNI